MSADVDMPPEMVRAVLQQRDAEGLVDVPPSLRGDVSDAATDGSLLGFASLLLYNHAL